MGTAAVIRRRRIRAYLMRKRFLMVLQQLYQSLCRSVNHSEQLKESVF